jgi:ABC-type transport system involved in multi-copper enzyme maturation permease subunit
MGLDTSHYHGWQGTLRPPWLASLALVRVALVQLFRRKVYWLVLALGLSHFLLAWGIIWAVNQVRIPDEAREGLLRGFGFASIDSSDGENGYVMFMQRQNLVVMLLLAFSGSLLVGSDFRQGTLPFYLSRRIDRRHYIAAKLLAVSAIVSLVTTVPALALFIEYGMFTTSFEYWLDNGRMVVSILGYGAVLAGVLSTLLVSLSAWLQRAAPIAITWSTAFVLLRAIGDQLYHETDDRRWRLLDLERNMRLVGRLIFERARDAEDRQFAQWAAVVLAALCAVALVALVHRVRAVDVVE